MILAKAAKIEGYRLYWEKMSDPHSCGHEILLQKSLALAKTNADFKNAYEQTMSLQNRYHYWIEPVYRELEK